MYLLRALLLLIVILHASNVFSAKEMCISIDGLRVCVQMKGPCELSHLAPHEKTNMKVDLFYVSITNNSRRTTRIYPEKFQGISTNGQVVVIDVPFYDSIELKNKLRGADLAPGDKVDGFLFFPSFMGAIRTIEYSGVPYFEMRLF